MCTSKPFRTMPHWIFRNPFSKTSTASDSLLETVNLNFSGVLIDSYDKNIKKCNKSRILNVTGYININLYADDVIFYIC